MSEVTAEITEEAPAAAPQSIAELEPKMKLSGVVTRLELYGAFIDIGVGENALIHISQLGKEHVNRVSDVLKVGDEVTVWIDKVDPERNQIMVSMIEPLAVDWQDLKTGQSYTGTVNRLETFGAFVDIGAEREGLVHISELSHDYVKHPSEVVKVGDEVEAQVLGFNKKKRRIDLSIKALQEKPETAVHSSRAQEVEIDYEDDFDEEMPTAMEFALRQAMGEDMPVKPRRKKDARNKRRQKNNRRTAQQEDILNRTLHG